MQMDRLTLGMLNAMGANIGRGRGTDTGIHAYTGSTGPRVRLEGDGPPPPMRPPSPAPTDDDLEMQEAIRMSLATVAAAATDVRGTAPPRTCWAAALPYVTQYFLSARCFEIRMCTGVSEYL